MHSRHIIPSVLLTCILVDLLGVDLLRADSLDDWRKMEGITPRGYVCYRAESPITIDGKMDDQAWKSAPWSEPFQDIEGDAKPVPRFMTRAKMLWDDTFFYIAADMEEPHVWGTLTKHDSVIFHDNDFEVFIDPDGDTHEYFEFEMNALNTGWDLFLPKPYKNGGKADNGWEIPGLKTAVHVDGTLNDPTDKDKGWSVEIAIPWQALREHAHKPSPPHDGDQWRVNFSRVEWRHVIQDGKYQKLADTREDNWVWSPQGIIDMHRPERWGFVQFSTAKSSGAQFTSDPDQAARESLMALYHHQKAYFQQHQQWAKSTDELDLPAKVKNAIVMQPTDDGFTAAAPLRSRAGTIRTMNVRQDSKLWINTQRSTLLRELERVLTTQAKAWNDGDIDTFMEHYWKSDQLTFSSGGKTARGWQTTKDNYKKRYPTPDAMGVLTFSELEATALGDNAALLLGRWRLERKDDELGGNFSLVFRRIDDNWLIVHDHTSSNSKPGPTENELQEP